MLLEALSRDINEFAQITEWSHRFANHYIPGTDDRQARHGASQGQLAVSARFAPTQGNHAASGRPQMPMFSAAKALQTQGRGLNLQQQFPNTHPRRYRAILHHGTSDQVL